MSVIKFHLIKEPVLFQGRNKRKNYFEGWYFKHVSPDRKNIISIIPGVSLEEGNSHAFIQTIIHTHETRGSSLSHYQKFGVEDFSYHDRPFWIRIGRNFFSCQGLEVDMKNNSFSLRGKINYSDLTGIKRSLLSPNAMGFFAYFPFMQCYHEIISMKHNLNGGFYLNDVLVDFSGGRGYIEKDWGTSFPKEYVWIHTNNFEKSDASLMCSIAHIPFMGLSFQGLICNLLVDGREYRFATYNNSKLKNISMEDGIIKICIEKGHFLLAINARMSEQGMLKAPQNGAMVNVIKESLNGIADVLLTDDSGKVLFSDVGRCCGTEWVREAEK